MHEIGTAIVDCAVHLHQDLGPGLPETVFEVTLARRLQKRGRSLNSSLCLCAFVRIRKIEPDALGIPLRAGQSSPRRLILVVRWDPDPTNVADELPQCSIERGHPVSAVYRGITPQAHELRG